MKRIKLLQLCFLSFHFILGFSQSNWEKISDYPEKIAGGFSFSVNFNGYVGGGWNPNAIKNFYEYNSILDQWERLNDFPGSFNGHPISVAVGNFGYVMTGSVTQGISSKEVWRYNPTGDKWTRLGDFPGPSRFEALGFVSEEKIYVGFGYNNELGYLKDFWEYDPALDNWERLSDFPGTARLDPIGFSLNGDIYCGLGSDSSTFNNDIWQYNLNKNEWIKKNEFPGKKRSRSNSFVIDGKAYMGMGITNGHVLNDFWEYDPVQDLWTALDSASMYPRMFAVSFVIANEGYLGLGSEGSETYRDMYKFKPQPQNETDESNSCEVLIHPNPSTKKFNVTNYSLRNDSYLNIVNSSGQLLLTTSLKSGETKEVIINSSGTVILYLISQNEILCIKKLVISN